MRKVQTIQSYNGDICRLDRGKFSKIKSRDGGKSNYDMRCDTGIGTREGGSPYPLSG